MKLEPAAWLGALAVLGSLLIYEGRRHEALAAKLPLEPKALYRELAKPTSRIQIVDLRSPEDYEDAHIPGALSLPGCDLSAAPTPTRALLITAGPAVIVTAEGEAEAFARCAPHFTSARGLAGGMAAWSDANYPEDVGEPVLPKPSAGGGCL